MTPPLKRQGPLRAAIYSRVSEDKTGQSRSVSQQDEHSHDVVKREKWHLAGEYRDNDIGASRWSKGVRPDWQRLLDDLAAGRIDVLVVWELSRGTRARMVWAALVEACIDLGVLLCVGGKLHDPRDPDDAFMLDLGMGLAVRESAITRKRVMRDQADAAAKGRPHGRVPYGYRRVYDERTGALLKQVIHEPEAEIVREIARRILGGETCRGIALDLNRREVPSVRGSSWVRTTVKGLIIKPSLAGLRQHRGQIIGKADWDGILTEGEFFALRGLLCDPARKSERPAAVKHLCTGPEVGAGVQCDVCGSGLAHGRRAPGRPFYLRCPNSHVGAPMAAVDEAISAAVCERLSRPDAVDIFRRGDEAGAREAAAEADHLQAQLDGFVDAAADGELTPTALGRIEARLLPRIEAARARAAVAGVPKVVAELVQADDVRAHWDALPITAKREVIRELGPFRLKRAGRQGPFAFDPARLVLPRRSGAVADAC